MSEKDANRLIDEWFLGKDLPMPVSGGDTATGKASEDAYNYTSNAGFLFDNDIQVADVNQGWVGSCYLVAAMGVIAEKDLTFI